MGAGHAMTLQAYIDAQAARQQRRGATCHDWDSCRGADVVDGCWLVHHTDGHHVCGPYSLQQQNAADNKTRSIIVLIAINWRHLCRSSRCS